ncbi:MAG: divergent polysaccharide deacetylase family protein [Candidatus Latescibacterota bacterium]
MLRRTPGRRPMVRQPPRVWWHLLLSAGLVLAAALALLYQQWQERPQEAPPPPAPLAVAVATSAQELADTLFVAVLSAAAEVGIPAPLVERQRGVGGPDRIVIRVPGGLTLAETNLQVARLARSRGGEVLNGEEAEGGRRVEVTCGFNGAPTTHFTLVRDPVAQRPTGSIAIVIDDTGGPVWNTARLERFCAVPQPLTFALLPSRSQAAEMARIAAEHGHEVMVHLPVEPRIDGREAGRSALRARSSDDEIRQRVRSGLRRLPMATGASAYLDPGARFSTRAMGLVVSELQPRGLLLLGDRRPLGSDLDSLARGLGSRALVRDLQLDLRDDPGAVEARIVDLARIAAQAGRAVGTACPTQGVLVALQTVLPRLEKRGMRFVTLSAVAR